MRATLMVVPSGVFQVNWGIPPKKYMFFAQKNVHSGSTANQIVFNCVNFEHMPFPQLKKLMFIELCHSSQLTNELLIWLIILT